MRLPVEEAVELSGADANVACHLHTHACGQPFGDTLEVGIERGTRSDELWREVTGWRGQARQHIVRCFIPIRSALSFNGQITYILPGGGLINGPYRIS